tara:strand:- start:1370 stop:2038 length:669 start_codon:yes stop_codon:yes gene_type:complete
MGIICLPYLFIPNKYLRGPINLWIKGLFKLLEFVCHVTYEIRGRENIPNYPILIASKHQSAFETFALFLHVNKSIFIHKKQLLNIPIFGQYLKKANMISINRAEGFAAMRKMLKIAKKKIQEGHSIIIFPEGTRKNILDSPNYKTGIIGLKKELETDILPVSVYSGHCWPKNTFLKFSGKIIISFLKIIPKDTDNSILLKKIETKIEDEQKIILKENNYKNL